MRFCCLSRAAVISFSWGRQCLDTWCRFACGGPYSGHCNFPPNVLRCSFSAIFFIVIRLERIALLACGSAHWAVASLSVLPGGRAGGAPLEKDHNLVPMGQANRNPLARCPADPGL